METLSPAQNNRETKGMSDPALITLTFSIATIACIDFMIHSNGLVSNPETRAFFQQYIGNLVNHIGNFGLAAAITIPITAIKKIAQYKHEPQAENEWSDKVVGYGSKFAIAAWIATIMATEGFAYNNHAFQDVSASVIAIFSSGLATEEVMRRLGVGRRRMIANNVDKHFTSSLPTSVEDYKYLADIPESVDALFSAVST